MFLIMNLKNELKASFGQFPQIEQILINKGKETLKIMKDQITERLNELIEIEKLYFFTTDEQFHKKHGGGITQENINP